MFRGYQGNRPELYKRTIDDDIGATSGSCRDLEQFINFCSTNHPALMQTFKVSETSIPVLDLRLSITENKITNFIHYIL